MAINKNKYLTATRPGMNGLGLLLWGWQCDFIIYAILMAVLVEIPRFISWRIQIKDNEFNYISDLSAIIFFLTVVYVFMTRSYPGIFTILSILPFLLFLVFLSQIYSTLGMIKPGALFISMRRLDTNEFQDINTGIDLSYPYLFLCLVSASAGNKLPIIFYIFIVLLITWTLWSLRPRHTRMFVWLFLFMIAGSSGYAGQIGIQKLQSIAESTFLQWFDQFMWRSRDPKRTNTAIGTLGKLKLSDRIMVRIKTRNRKLTEPLLLRESSYLSYGYGIWTNFQNTFQVIDPAAGGKQWILNPATDNSDTLTISFYLDDEIAIIPAPLGTTSISNVNASEIEYSPYGSISMELNPGWVIYDVTASNGIITDAAPDKDDLELPAIYKKELNELVQRLGLQELDPAEKVRKIKQFFADNFTYSLTQKERYPRGKYLTKFLFETKKGHCEYYATATALILRAAGIPSRYIVGYSVQEYSKLEDQYIARARDAHSWVLAYVKDKWQIVDTTPAVWAALESEEASIIEPLIDFWSWLAYMVATWDTKNSESGKTSTFIWLLVPVLLFYLWKMFIRPRMGASGDSKLAAKKPDTYQILHANFYKLLQALEKQYGERKPGETLLMWIARLEKNHHSLGCNSLLILYYRYRYDPAGLQPDEENELNSLADTLLAKMNI
jgi:protein-glutamine gamma-glutamyltransferase